MNSKEREKSRDKDGKDRGRSRDRDRRRPSPDRDSKRRRSPRRSISRDVKRENNSSARDIEPQQPVRIHIGRLTRNVNREHLIEIFSNFGEVAKVELPMERNYGSISRGYCYISYKTQEEAENAMKHMDGGQIDGQEVTAAPTFKQNFRNFGNDRRRMSPMRGNFRGNMRNHNNRGFGRRSPIRRRYIF